MRQRWLAALAGLLLAGGSWLAVAQQAPVVTVASKTFSESYVLAELAAQLLEDAGFAVERRHGLGGTLIAFGALERGEIDVYPEYTGTLVRAVLKSPGMELDGLNEALSLRGLRLDPLLGFNNSYALTVPAAVARERNLRQISQLRQHPDLAVGFSHEFLERGDGWRALRDAYQLPHSPTGIEHALAYRALASGHLDLTDAYTTDGELALYDLVQLEDDRQFFPAYLAGFLVQDSLPAAARAALGKLEGRLDEEEMQRLNQLVAGEGNPPAEVASGYLRQSGLVTDDAPALAGRWSRIGENVLVHLRLTLTALVLACLVAIPLSLCLVRYARLSGILLYSSGLLQTIPALALLALLIPLFGLGELPAVLALFLYSLLPVVRNTLTGVAGVDPLLREVALGMGLTDGQILRRIELPLAAPMILAGVKTAAIISIGTATLAAFVGAGGLGEPIITGLTLNDHALILEGAIPAAGLAIGVELMFELVGRRLTPVHLRQNRPAVNTP
jgi:osmoprotectant transport system permease protein